MHHTRGRLARPVAGEGRRRHARASSTPDAPCVAVRHSPRLSAAAAASSKATNLASSPRESDAGGDSVIASQVLLSPPPPRYLCDWTQAIICEYQNLKPFPCQRDGCDTLVHHLCQSAWEQREGYNDTVARYCCIHHPDYKYRSAPPKDLAMQEDDAVIARAKDVVVQAKVIIVKSQLMAEGIEELAGDEMGCDSIGDDEVVGMELPPFEITDYTADTYDIHERTTNFMERRPISAVNCCAVEAVYMIEALTIVRSMRTMHKPGIAAKVQDKYKELIRNIPIERFSDSSLKVMTETKYYRAKGSSADGLLTKATDVLKNVRVMAGGIRGIGTPLHQIPSGRSLMDMRNQFILSKWSEMQGAVYRPSNNDDELVNEVTDGWWLLSPTTYLLCRSCSSQ